MSWLSAVGDWVLGLAGSPWAYVALAVLATIDGFFPPVPSETVVIALASLSVSTGQPLLWLVALAAAIGAFCGDQVAYTIGKRVDLRARGLMQGERQQRTLAWAERALRERGAALIIAARYIPVGRVAVNMTAGGLGYPRARFSALVAVAAVSWAGYTVALGSVAGHWFGHSPWLAVVVGVAGGLVLGAVADPVLSWVGRRMGWRALAGRPSEAPLSEEASLPEEAPLPEGAAEPGQTPVPEPGVPEQSSGLDDDLADGPRGA